jgi:hypothetical protein
MSDEALPGKADGKLKRASEDLKKRFHKESDFFESYTLAELIQSFGTWPTYMLLWKKLDTGKSGRVAVGVGVVGAVVLSIAAKYLWH